MKGGSAKLTKPLSDSDRGVGLAEWLNLMNGTQLSGWENNGYDTGHWYYCIFSKLTMTVDIKHMPTKRVPQSEHELQLGDTCHAEHASCKGLSRRVLRCDPFDRIFKWSTLPGTGDRIDASIDFRE